MAALRRWLSLTVMPASLAAAIAAALLGMQAGAPPASLVPPIFVGAIVWVAALERVLPYRRDWNRPRGDWLADAAYLPTTSAVIAGMRSLTAAAGVWIGGWISVHVGLSLWPHSWPLLAQLPLAWVVVDFDTIIQTMT